MTVTSDFDSGHTHPDRTSLFQPVTGSWAARAASSQSKVLRTGSNKAADEEELLCLSQVN